ncbi:SGNH/GDSL hydrolase family protein [Krasilnikovia sp. M28-CT-15]|uniref:SGNH/GDSL hydrolase family protein n=1 Tax=Krasilnikovia sp. M28-CT-15 TaxID=3373540 RepID=UPI003875FF74
MRRRIGTLLVASLAATAGLTGGRAAAASPQQAAPTPPPAQQGSQAPDGVAPADRPGVIGKDWKTSGDRMWTTAGDATGLHLLAADAKAGYTWRTVATLAEPDIITDQWIGNACLTGSGKRAVVVYEPRHFANRTNLFDQGAFAAVVDMASGEVTKLNINVSIAYYNPGCGSDETATLTQSGAAELGRTRIHVVDTAARKITTRVELPGQVTSAVPVLDKIAAYDGTRILSINHDGKASTLTKAAGAIAHLTADGHGGLTYLERAEQTTVVRHLAAAKATVQEIGRGSLSDVSLARGTGGRVFITGKPQQVGTLPQGVSPITSPTDAEISTTGAAILTPADRAADAPADEDGSETVGLHATFRATGRSADFAVDPTERVSARQDQGQRPAPQLKALGAPERVAAAATAGSATDPTESDRYCAVSRNDLTAQVEQPMWTQVEWAANLAVQGNLTLTRPQNWHGSGLPAWSPQALEKPIDLAGGGHVPAQILLGILAQESNLWQASYHALEGVPGNPLVGAYYGNRTGWSINFEKADCGYGVSQVTDGMRKAGRTKPGEKARPADEQKAIAVDYATNIAAGLRILQEKWNTTRNAGITINDGNAARPENWFAAVWAYNSGLNPQASTGNTTGCSPGPSCTDSRGNWGLGWGNNPANPDYPFNRKPFLDGDGDGNNGQADAANPQRWPYPEKIMGWAAYPIVKSDYRRPGFYTAAYRQAFWKTGPLRTLGMKPPLTTFCSAQNNCTTANGQPNGAGLCKYTDYHCWWHWPASWEPNCDDTCGFENPNPNYTAGSPEPARGNHYPPICTRQGLPDGSLIVDDVESDSPLVRSDECSPGRVSTQGKFSLTFNGTAVDYPSKIDFHQLGTGLNGHVWFSHEESVTLDNLSKVGVTGRWALEQPMNQWAKVWVHLPHTIGESQQAHYKIDRGENAPAAARYKWRVIGQHRGGSEWVSLGAFQMQGKPSVSLSNVTRTEDSTAGVDNIVWDAVAFQPLPKKPTDFVVAMGDSYSSGEGIVDDQVTGYYPDSNHNSSSSGDNAFRNGCHRSPNAWSRQGTLADDSRTIGQRDNDQDKSMDYHMVACSGTQSEHMLPSAENPITGRVINDPDTGRPFTNGWGEAAGRAGGSMREVTQMDSGFLDENTTLVTITVGGNDVGWSGVVQQCYMSLSIPDCMEQDDDEGHRLRDYVPEVMEQKLRPTLVTMLRAITTMAPNAKVVLMGYPKLLEAPGTCLNVTGPIGIGISPTETAWLNQSAVEMAALENEIATTARQTGMKVWYANPIPAFEGKGVCALPDLDWGIHGVKFTKGPGEKPNGPSSDTFHPTQRGGRLYRDALNTTLRTMGS